jgi:hypothetical protein
MGSALESRSSYFTQHHIELYEALDRPTACDTYDEAAANARLIAAAPDLLDACKIVRQWLCDTRLIDPKDPIANPAFIKANNAVLKAIAKAEC